MIPEVRFSARASMPPAALAAVCMLLSGCGGAKTVKPEAFYFEPTIVGCSAKSQECGSATARQVRELTEAHNHRCPADKPKILIKADGRFVCVAFFPPGGPPLIGASVPAVVRRGGPGALAEFETGERITARTGCLACHRIAEAGNRGPGAELTDVGSRLQPRAIERALVYSPAPMPSLSRLPSDERRALVYFLSQLR